MTFSSTHLSVNLEIGMSWSPATTCWLGSSGWTAGREATSQQPDVVYSQVAWLNYKLPVSGRQEDLNPGGSDEMLMHSTQQLDKIKKGVFPGSWSCGHIHFSLVPVPHISYFSIFFKLIYFLYFVTKILLDVMSSLSEGPSFCCTTGTFRSAWAFNFYGLQVFHVYFISKILMTRMKAEVTTSRIRVRLWQSLLLELFSDEAL